MQAQTIEFRAMLAKFLKGDFSTEESKKNFKQIENHINELTKSKEAWNMVLQILLTEDDKQVKYFASNILKDKMKYDYGQLTPEMFASVHDRILQILRLNPKPDSGLLFNMSLTVVYVYMHQAEKIGDLLQYLAKYLGAHGLVNYIFNVLLLLPEEVDNYKVVIEERKRSYLLQYIRSIQTKVLVELNVVATQQWQQNNIKKEILLGCLSNWIELQYKKTIMEGLHHHFMLNAALSYIGDTSISKECESAIITVMRTMKGYTEDPDLFSFLGQRIFAYFPVVKKLLDDKLVDMCDPYLKVLSKFGRLAATRFIRNVDNTSLLFQENMLFLTKNVGIDNIQQIVKYWQRFCVKLHQEKNPSITVFVPLLCELYQTLCHIGEYTVEQCQDLNIKSTKQLQDQHQDFEDKQKYRREIDQVFDVIGQLISYEKCVELSLMNISKLDVNSKKFWCQFESLLLPLVDIIDEIHQPSQALTDTILKLVQLQPVYYCVQKAIIRVLSRCSKIYTSNQDVTKTIFTFLVSKLQDARFTNQAAAAFENVCDNNTKFVVQNINIFMEVLKNFKQNEKILQGIAVAVATREQYMLKYLPELCRPYIEQITSQKDLEKLKTALKRLTETIVKATHDGSVSCAPIIIQAFKVVWPTIKPIIENPSSLNAKSSQLSQINSSLIERSCKFIKACMRCLKDKFGPFVNEVYSSIFKAYEKYPIATYVYMVEIVVTVFSDYPEYKDTLSLIYFKTCEITFNHLSKLEKFESNPDLAEDFFGMNLRFMRYAPHIILYCDKLDGLLTLCTIASGVQHREIANTLYMFIQSMYMVFWSQEFIVHYNNNAAESEEFKIIIRPNYQDGYSRLKERLLMANPTIITKMIEHFSKAPSQTVRDSIRDAMLAEIKAFPQLNVNIWTPILGHLGEDILTVEEKRAFLQLLPNVRHENIEQIRQYVYLISKRFIHRKMRTPLA